MNRICKRKGNKSEKNRVSDMLHLIVVQFSLKIMFQTAQMCIQTEDHYLLINCSCITKRILNVELTAAMALYTLLL